MTGKGGQRVLESEREGREVGGVGGHWEWRYGEKGGCGREEWGGVVHF